MTEQQEAATEEPTGTDGESGEKQEKTFTQAEVNAIVKKKADELYRRRVGDVDLDDLKAKAGKATTAEERIANLEKEIEATKREALRRRVQAAHQISDEDADLFLTGADETTLTAQAERLAARDSERKKQGNRAPNEGRTPNPPKADESRELARSLFGRTD